MYRGSCKLDPKSKSVFVTICGLNELFGVCVTGFSIVQVLQYQYHVLYYDSCFTFLQIQSTVQLDCFVIHNYSTCTQYWSTVLKYSYYLLYSTGSVLYDDTIVQ